MAFVLNVFGAICVQKNVRDLVHLGGPMGNESDRELADAAFSGDRV